jgi:hypothetical protein
MYSGTVSVPFAIRQVLSSNPLYLQAIQSRIANYTALAQKIKPNVEKIIGSKVNIGTIVVAIKRFADILQKEQQENKMIINSNSNFLEGARMSLTGSIIDVDFDDRDFDELSDILDEMFEKETSNSPVYYNLFQTNKQLRLFTENIKEIRKILSTTSKKFDGKMREGLSKITITFPSTSSNTNMVKHVSRNPYNILSIVSDVLYKNQISLHDAFFTPNEIVIILDDKDAAKTYELLRAKVITKG